MSDTSPLPSPSSQSLERLREQAIAALVPFFVTAGSNDDTAARMVAQGVLDEYHAATPKELQLAAEIIAASWASLACLSAGMVVKDSSLEAMMRFQDYALKLDRSSQKATKTLEARRKERAKNPAGMAEENTSWDEGAFQLAINQALEKLHEANAKLAVYMAALMPAEKKPKLSFAFGEPMTPSVLARLGKR
jgi:hypothetical protein